MWDAGGKGLSETRENCGGIGSKGNGQTGAGAAEVVSGALAIGEQAPHYRLRNLTGRDFRLIYRSEDGSEVVRLILRDSARVRVRYNRMFDRQPVESYRDPEGTGARIHTVESRPRAGVLPTCESIEGLPPAEGGVRLVVDPAVVFGLARRGTFRRDLLTLGFARKDPITRRVIGYENLSRVNFDNPPELEEMPSLMQQEDWQPE